VASGVGAAYVHDAGPRVAPFASQLVVEADSEAPQLFNPRRSLLRQQLDRAGSADAAACSDRVGGVQRRVVVRADRCGHASLGGIAVGARVRSLGEDEDRRARVGRRESRGEAGDPGSDDDHVGSLAFLPHKR